MRRLSGKIREVGLINCVLGGIKRERYKWLCRRDHFDSWHISPYELREYLQATAEYINERNAKVVVDIGCGLGEMLRHVQAEVRVGFDIHEEPIKTAQRLSRGDIRYQVGSFAEVNIERPIDYLVTLGFMHGNTEETWRSNYHEVARRNDIRHFIVDIIPEGYDGAHCLDFSKILPSNYKLIDRIGPFLGGRWIEIYEKEAQAADK